MIKFKKRIKMTFRKTRNPWEPKPRYTIERMNNTVLIQKDPDVKWSSVIDEMIYYLEGLKKLSYESEKGKEAAGEVQPGEASK